MAEDLDPIRVVIPTLREPDTVGRLVSWLHRDPEPFEIVVADAGVCPRTRDAARRAGARVILAPRGRARQMNAGARDARDGILWFVHADSQPPPGAGAAIRRVLLDPAVACGAFRFRIDSTRLRYRPLELWVRVRSEWLKRPFGDQGLFMRASRFLEVGGYPDVPILEDLLLVRALARLGRIAIAPEPLRTSARRFERNGLIPTALQHGAIQLLHACGVSSRRLAGWRDPDSSRPEPFRG